MLVIKNDHKTSYVASKISEGVTYVALTLCFKLNSFFSIDFCCFLSISNVTVIYISFLYFSVCLQSVHFYAKFSCHGNTLLTVFSISEFSDPKHIL